MRFVAIAALAMAVAAPLAAQAAPSPQRWAASLDARIVETYSYTRTLQQEDCIVRRFGPTTRELVVRSVRPTVVAVSRAGARAVYRPGRLARVRVTGTAGGGEWRENVRCRAGPIKPVEPGSCSPTRVRPMLIRPAFRRVGANRIAFRPQAVMRGAVKLCGIDRSVINPDAWLSWALGRTDEEALLGGRTRRVVARAEVTRDVTLVDDPRLTVTQKLRVTWTLTFRRLR